MKRIIRAFEAEPGMDLWEIGPRRHLGLVVDVMFRPAATLDRPEDLWSAVTAARNWRDLPMVVVLTCKDDRQGVLATGWRLYVPLEVAEPVRESAP